MSIPPPEAAELMRSIPNEVRMGLINSADNVIDCVGFFTVLTEYGTGNQELYELLVSEISPNQDSDNPPKGTA